MAIQFVPGQVAIGDPSPTHRPTATSNIKDVIVKVIKLTSANFAVTTAVNTRVAVLPADATVLTYRLWVKTQLAGGGITAATLALGTTSGGTDLFAANAVAFNTAGVDTTVSPATGLMQNYNLPLGPDINVWASGLATTGTPTSGEMYLTIVYVR